jgi:hypothetical protein
MQHHGHATFLQSDERGRQKVGVSGAIYSSPCFVVARRPYVSLACRGRCRCSAPFRGRLAAGAMEGGERVVLPLLLPGCRCHIVLSLCVRPPSLPRRAFTGPHVPPIPASYTQVKKRVRRRQLIMYNAMHAISLCQYASGYSWRSTTSDQQLYI